MITNSMKHVKKLGIYSFIIIIFFSSCRKSVLNMQEVPYLDTSVHHYDTINTHIDSTDDGNMLMGNLSNAVADTIQPDNYLMVKQYYALSYNRSRSIPNWVSWHVKLADLGTITRQDDFRADSSLPPSWFYADETSYFNSGFDRGHNCPSGDRTSTVAANSSTFLMTNMIPQAPYLNQQTWGLLEDSIRQLVHKGNEVFVIMGSYGSGGTGNNGSATAIANGKVTVPANVWKVIVVIPDGSQDLIRVSASTRVIAVNTPNINTVNRNWKLYRTSVDNIEALTGYNILSNVTPSIQQTIESKIDNL